MRFQRLQIPAFGPFTLLDLPFPEGSSDFHVIFGANEAGKSSLLRAFRDLLFGIHGQSPDNFLHDYKSLRIKAEIRNHAGKSLIFQRRKGNKNTLLDENDGQLPDHALNAFLGSVDQSYFSTTFGLGARELREGAQELLRGKGDMGNVLFSASIGGTPIQKVIDALQADADRIFKGRATASVTLRPAATRYKDLLKQSREAMVKPEVWATLQRAFDQAEADKIRIEAAIAELQSNIDWLQRCSDALPTVSRLAEENEKLNQLPPLPPLASDYVSRARSVRQRVMDTQAETKRLATQQARLQQKLDECKTAPEIVSKGDLLDQLRQDLSVYRDRKKKLADLQAKLAALETTLASKMKSLQLPGEIDSLETRRLSAPMQLACKEAAQTVTDALRAKSANDEKLAELESQIAEMEAELETLPEPDLTGLRDALAVAAEATDAARTIAASESDVRRLTREAADQHRLIAGAPADFEETSRLPVPSTATIRRYAEEMKNAHQEIAAEEKEKKALETRQTSLKAELTRLQRQGELPTEEALRRAREHRDRGWKLILDDWKGDGAKEELMPDAPLEIAFPEAIKGADDIADRLRRDAELVAQADEKRFQLRETEERIGKASERIGKLRESLTELQASWSAEWSPCSVTPSSPDEMAEWRDQWREFRDRLEKLETAKDDASRKARQILAARQRLASVLGQSEEKEFSALFESARKLVQAGEQATGQRMAATKRLDGFKRDLNKLKANQSQLSDAVEESAAKWRSQCGVAGLPDDTSPDAGRALMQEREKLLVTFDEWQDARHEAASLTNAVSSYEREVGDNAVALGLAADTTEATVSQIWNTLKEAREAQTRHDQLAEDVEQVDADLAEANRLANEAENDLSTLLKTARLNTIDELEPLLANLERRDALQREIDNLRNTLFGPARGQSVDDFIENVRAENPDTLAERKTAAERDKDDAETALTSVRETLYRLGKDKRDLEEASDAAANFLQQAESAAATLKQDAARFLRLRLAIHLLQSQIERFRKENQGPLLRKSGEVFNAITRGAFSGLGADFNADDIPVLVGLRPDETKVPVEGMSEGSRDQLYLALRLAALDRYLEEHEPMPLILDDLLITFDNDRTKAILPQLSEMAKRTQVFLFTHHQHLIDLCHQTLSKDGFKLHQLDAR